VEASELGDSSKLVLEKTRELIVDEGARLLEGMRAGLGVARAGLEDVRAGVIVALGVVAVTGIGNKGAGGRGI
jgi:hypothetical protein